MSVEATLVCDDCGRIILAADTPAKARREGREGKMFQRIQGQELCTECVRLQYPSRVAADLEADEGPSGYEPIGLHRLGRDPLN